ncbi:MAG: hypothetical protein ACOZIN_03540 [Myxococcota bacterium]
MHKLKVLFHDNCFDGAASAAVFTRFYRERVRADVEVEYQGLSHQAGGEGIDPAAFSGDENAVVDFRYSRSPGLTWWFDHHQSAFQQDGDEAHFRADRSGRKFHDPTRKSCTKYLADVCKAHFGFDPTPLRELIEWADLIDAARFSSPQEAVELAEPALELMAVLEASKEPQLTRWIIEQMQTKPLEVIAASARVQEALKPLRRRQREALEAVRARATFEGGVVFFDLTGTGFEGVNKFFSYFLFPEASYTVWVGQSGERPKISIGANPWRPQLRRHDLARIAERYGGGGHAVVAGISFREGEVERARQVANNIAAELRDS